MEKKTHVIVASIILSILVWLSVSMNNEYAVSLKVPLRISNMPDEMALGRPVPPDITVRLRGTGWQLAAAYFSTTSSINIDAGNLDRRTVVLSARDLGYSLDLGSSAEVLGFMPDTVVIVTDTVVNRKVPVIPRVTIEPRQNYTVIGDAEVTPDSVRISGARRLIGNIRAWYTIFKRFRNVDEDIDVTLPLSDTLKDIVHLSDRSVMLKADVEQIADNTFRSIPVGILDNRDSVNVLLLPPVVDITVRGGIGLLSEMTADSFKASVDYGVLFRSSSSHFQPVVKIPENLQLISIQPDSVEFVIRR